MIQRKKNNSHDKTQNKDKLGKTYYPYENHGKTLLVIIL